jgi:hypothetical protein
MPTAQRLQGTDGLETLRWLARRQGYQAALDHALTTAQSPGSRLHTDAWQWVIGPDAGLFRACREAIAMGREALLTEWVSALDALSRNPRGLSEPILICMSRPRKAVSCLTASRCSRVLLHTRGAAIVGGRAAAAGGGGQRERRGEHTVCNAYPPLSGRGTRW